MVPDTTLKPSKIDKEIRELIMKMNELPFLKTQFCCAGYGETGDWTGNKVEPKDHSEYGYGGAYVSIKYDKRRRGWREFHKDMTVVGSCSIEQGRHSYYFGIVLYDTIKYNPQAFEDATTVDDLKRAWEQVEGIVDRHLALSSNG